MSEILRLTSLGIIIALLGFIALMVYAIGERMSQK